jgi:hypothetical protein
VAKKMGCTDEEIREAVQVAYSVGAGAMWAMAARAEKAADERFRWWDKRSVEKAMEQALRGEDASSKAVETTG